MKRKIDLSNVIKVLAVLAPTIAMAAETFSDWAKQKELNEMIDQKIEAKFAEEKWKES